MDRQRVYIGVYKSNNQESLFYQRGIDVFYDLKQKRNVSSNEIEKESLIPYSNIIECKSNFKKNIIKLYDLDRMEKISLTRVFIGNIFIMEDTVSSTNYYQEEKSLIVVSETNTSIDLVKKDALLMVPTYESDIMIEYCDIVDLETNELYSGNFIAGNGHLYVPRNKKHLRSVTNLFLHDEEEIEKSKLLEKYREYKRR